LLDHHDLLVAALIWSAVGIEIDAAWQICGKSGSLICQNGRHVFHQQKDGVSPAKLGFQTVRFNFSPRK
jgi:hypothetical protein